jgi:hypothetical protein
VFFFDPWNRESVGQVQTAYTGKIFMKIPRSLLLGIFSGEEIYYTGVVHTPSRKSVYNIFGGDKFSGKLRGMDRAFQSKVKKK